MLDITSILLEYFKLVAKSEGSGYIVMSLDTLWIMRVALFQIPLSCLCNNNHSIFFLAIIL